MEKTLDTTDEWIRSRTGISARRVVDAGTVTSDLAAEAARRALQDARVEPAEVDLVVVATGSPDMLWPSTACVVMDKLGLACPGFDVSAACSGFVYALTVTGALIASGQYRTVLLIGADALSRHLNWADRKTCVLFGDGAGAMVLQAVQGQGDLIASVLGADGSGADLLKIPAGGNAIPPSTEAVAAGLQYITMNGPEVFKLAVRATCDAVRQVLGRAKLTIDEVQYLLPHQANQRITDAAAENLGLPMAKVPANIDKYGNTSTASIPLLMDELCKDGRLAAGDVVVLVGFGAGFTWGANVVRWSRGGRG